MKTIDLKISGMHDEACARKRFKPCNVRPVFGAPKLICQGVAHALRVKNSIWRSCRSLWHNRVSAQNAKTLMPMPRSAFMSMRAT